MLIDLGMLVVDCLADCWLLLVCVIYVVVWLVIACGILFAVWLGLLWVACGLVCALLFCGV